MPNYISDHWKISLTFTFNLIKTRFRNQCQTKLSRYNVAIYHFNLVCSGLNFVASNGKIMISQKISPSRKTFWFPKQHTGLGLSKQKQAGCFSSLSPCLHGRRRATYKSWNMWWDMTGRRCEIEMGWKLRYHIFQCEDLGREDELLKKQQNYDTVSGWV